MKKRGLRLTRKLFSQLEKQGLNKGQLAQVKPAGSKMRNRHTVVDNITFDSQLEARRYEELKQLQRAGLIGELNHHVLFPLIVMDIEVGNYEADFTYWENGSLVVEDAKGRRTPHYVLKRNLMRALYGISIIEITAPRRRR
jgi:hypothetical protein